MEIYSNMHRRGSESVWGGGVGGGGGGEGE